MAVLDRSRYLTRIVRNREEVSTFDDVRHLTPGERMSMVWQLTLQAWMFKTGREDEPRLCRHVVRTVRGRG